MCVVMFGKQKFLGSAIAGFVEGGEITRAGLAWFGMGPTPIRAKAAELRARTSLARLLAKLSLPTSER